MLHRASHSPPTPSPQYRTTTAVSSTVVISPTLREEGEAREVEMQRGISYSGTITTIKREWREEWDNEGVGEWVAEWATSKESHSTLYFDFMNRNCFLDLVQHIDESVTFLHYPIWLQPLQLRSFILCVFIIGTLQLRLWRETNVKADWLWLTEESRLLYQQRVVSISFYSFLIILSRALRQGFHWEIWHY